MAFDVLTRIENLERGLTTKQAALLEKVRHQMAVAVARTYGPRLHTLMAEKLVREVVMRPEVLAHLEGATIAELPSDADGWRSWACDAVNACELSQRSLAASDDALRQRLTDQALRTVPPARKMAMAREGTLDKHVASEVRGLLERELNNLRT